MAKPRHAKTRVPAVDTCVADWIGGHCLHSPGDCNVVGVFSFFVSRLLLSRKNFFSEFATLHLVLADRRATARTTTFVEPCSIQTKKMKSSVNLLSASIRVDWFSLPIENFLDRMPLLRQRFVKGVFLTKASSPWAGNKSQSIQVSLCLPNQRDLDTWYEAVFALPLAWPDITDIDPHCLKKTSAHQLLFIRMQMGVSHMWGGLSPQWHLLKYHLWNAGPSYHTGRLEELLILNAVSAGWYRSPLAQVATLVQTLTSEFLKWTGRCCLYPLVGS